MMSSPEYMNESIWYIHDERESERNKQATFNSRQYITPLLPFNSIEWRVRKRQRKRKRQEKKKGWVRREGRRKLR
jgi:hypothetical protein